MPMCTSSLSLMNSFFVCCLGFLDDPSRAEDAGGQSVYNRAQRKVGTLYETTLNAYLHTLGLSGITNFLFSFLE